MSDPNTSMALSTRAVSPGLAVVIYVVAILVLGAVLAPLMDSGLRFLVSHGMVQSLADTPFRRVANRAFMVVAIAGLWPLSRAVGRVSRDALGLTMTRPVLLRSIGYGFVGGIVSLTLLVCLEYAVGVVVWDANRSSSELMRALFSGILSGFVISAIEEPVFRGFFHYQFHQRWGKWVAALGSAIPYAAVHFIRSQGDPDPVVWYSGFTVLQSAFAAYARPETLGPFVALVAVGFWLSLIRDHCGHLGWGIGLHAGWVAVIRIGKKATNLTDDPGLSWLAGGYDQITGWLAAGWLILLMGIWLLWIRRRSSN